MALIVARIQPADAMEFLSACMCMHVQERVLPLCGGAFFPSLQVVTYVFVLGIMGLSA